MTELFHSGCLSNLNEIDEIHAKMNEQTESESKNE